MTNTLKRIYSRVNFNGPVPAHCPEIGNCHVWTGYCTKLGHGQVRIEGKTEIVHRYLYIRRHGPLPPKLCVLHHCDNPACVRDEHHFKGTRKNNAQDKVQKGRQARGAKHAEAIARGKGSVLDAPKVQLARTLWKQHDPTTGKRLWSQRKIAAHLGVPRATMEAALRGETWKHLL